MALEWLPKDYTHYGWGTEGVLWESASESLREALHFQLELPGITSKILSANGGAGVGEGGECASPQRRLIALSLQAEASGASSL